MKLFILAAAASMALAAGCDRAAETSSPSKPSTASAGAGTAAPKTGPAGESVPVPQASTGPASSADTKPDPGDANDHSNPRHDARNKKNGD